MIFTIHHNTVRISFSYCVASLGLAGGWGGPLRTNLLYPALEAGLWPWLAGCYVLLMAHFHALAKALMALDLSENTFAFHFFSSAPEARDRITSAGAPIHFSLSHLSNSSAASFSISRRTF